VRGTDSDEALRRSAEGYLTEGATSNVFFVEDGRLLTPTAELPLLPGVTREVVLELAGEADVPVETGRYGPGRLHGADEVFVTNSTWELRPVSRVDDSQFDPGPVTRRLQRLYDERVEALY